MRILAVTCAFVVLGCGSSTPAPADGSAQMDGAPAGDAPAAHGAAPGGDHAGPGALGGGTSEKCEHLATTCHEHAAFSALSDECHKIGHGGDAAKCEARHDECMAECQKAAKSGAHPHPAGSAGHPPGAHH